MSKTFKIQPRVIKLLCLSLLAIAAIFIGHFALIPEVITKKNFDPVAIPLNTYDLHDLAIVDINNDQKLDVVTSNHSALQSVALNQGNENFKEYLTDSGLNQDRDFPGTEVSNNVQKFEQSGLYIYRKNRFRWGQDESDNKLVLSAHNTSDRSTIKGKISLFSAVKINKNQNFELNLQESKVSSDTVKTVLEFAVNGNGELVLETDLTALPTKIQIDENVPLNSVHLGSSKLHPKNHSFQLEWRDRHGMAWADFDGDGATDAFITRGGLKGKLEEISAISKDNFFADELFSATSGKFKDIAQQSGLEKKNCPGRQTSWTDFNGDDRLDLYIVCGRGVPPLGDSPNQLYQQIDDVRFVDVASDLGLAFPERGTFAWLDINRDRSIDLLWATKNAFKIFNNQNGKFELSQEIDHNLGRIKKLSMADFDSDADLDIFVVGSRNNLLLLRENANFTKIQPSSIGLPDKALTANWVDYDNDGLIDFHAVPEGIFHQTSNHQFQATDLLKCNSRLSKIVDARSAWFDANNDGFRDLLIALNYRPWWLRGLSSVPRFDLPDLRNSQAKLYINKVSPKNNWLQLELVGRDKNPQAIGTMVEIETETGKQLLRVGDGEGSHFSQGHYRIYLGLGKRSKVGSIRVFWTNGQTEEFNNLAVNRLNFLRQGSGV